jgi:hypothetical protein
MGVSSEMPPLDDDLRQEKGITMAFLRREPAAAPEADEEMADLDAVMDSPKTAGKKKEGRGRPSPSPTEEGAAVGAAESEGRTRSWFPESFLWQPLLLTDASGQASVDVRVPDQLTTWRVLGLAHSRDGSQAGAVHTFDSRLPVFIDPVVPAFLMAGDTLALPVQVMNSTDAALSLAVQAAGEGGLSGAGQIGLDLGAMDSDVATVRLTASSAGVGRVRARVDSSAGFDEAVRELPILPVGRPVQASRGGTLAGARTFQMATPAGADPSTQALTVQVYPGALAVLQAEVERLQGGARPEDGAYGFALSSQMNSLATASGVEVDPGVLRGLRVVAWQRVARASRSPDAGQASDLLSAMGGVRDHTLAEALRPRLVRVVLDGQRGDGTWARQDRATLQAVLVQTAWAARALPKEEEGPRLRAGGAIERYAPQVDDAYTAAVLLASGVIRAGAAEKMRAIVLEGVDVASDGRRSVRVPAGVLNPWGYRPSRTEMLAWTALALADRTELDWRFDLVAELMASYDATWGFGAGVADSLALDAIAVGLPALQEPVSVVLTVNGEERARAALDPKQPRVPAILAASIVGDEADIRLEAVPPVPGLAFVSTLDSWVAWTGTELLPGVEVEVALSPLRAGATGSLQLVLSAPSNASVVVEQGIPAGCTVDEVSLMASGQLTAATVLDDRIRLTTRPFQAGEVMTLIVPVQPAYAGTFSTGPLSLKQGADRVDLAPLEWRVSASTGR